MKSLMDCSAVGDCGTPPNIELGYWRKCGGGVEYKCVDGTEMSGTAEIECQNGMFSPSPPTCSCKYGNIKHEKR